MAADIKAIDNAPLALALAEAARPRERERTVPAQQPVATESAPRLDPVPQTREGLERLAQRLREYTQSMNRRVEFTVDEESGYTVIKVVDPETQKVIRQIPAEVTLRLARHLDPGGQGVLFSDEA